jgi:5-methylcytosine-specific restriction endonuclease McrA
MATKDPRLWSYARRQLRKTTGALGLPCRKCGQPIDYNGPWDLGEIIPRTYGGDPLDPTNVAAECQRCNRAAGAAITNQRRNTQHTRPIEAKEW